MWILGITNKESRMSASYRLYILISTMLLSFAPFIHAVTITWDDEAMDKDWTNPINWDGDGLKVDFSNEKPGVYFIEIDGKTERIMKL